MGTEHLPPGRKDAPRFETDHPGKDGWRFPAAGKKSGKKILHSPDIEGRLMFKISKDRFIFLHLLHDFCLCKFLIGNIF